MAELDDVKMYYVVENANSILTCHDHHKNISWTDFTKSFDFFNFDFK